MRTISLIVLLTLLPQLAWADTPAPVVPVPTGDDNIVVVHKNDPAPFTGQLFDQPTALRWANYLQQYKFRLQADVEYQKKYDEIALQLAQKRLELERDQYQRVTADFQKRLTDAQKQLAEGPPWYSSFGFGVALGVGAAVLSALAAGYLFSAVR